MKNSMPIKEHTNYKNFKQHTILILHRNLILKKRKKLKGWTPSDIETALELLSIFESKSKTLFNFISQN